MMEHGRKYGDKDSHPIPLWNGVFEHYERVRDALWEFAWCVDKITEEHEGVGMVLGGAPIKIGDIVADLKGSRKETVRRHMDSLEAESYIRRRRTPYGHVIEVLNSRKFGIWKKEKPQKDVSLGIEKPIYGSEKPIYGSEKPQKVVYKEDSAVTQQYTAALWRLTEIDPHSLPGPFRKMCEELWPTRGGQALSEFLGVCMDAWKVQGGKSYPATFAKAKARIAAKERTQKGNLPELEAEPWQK